MAETSSVTVVDEIKKVLTDFWNANSPAVLQQAKPGEIIYGDQERKDLPSDRNNRVGWCRLTIRHYGGKQTSMAGPDGKATYTNNGELTVQVFASFRQSNDEDTCRKLTDVARKAYMQRSHVRKVWYREVRMEERGADGPWFQINVKAKFTWDEVR